jgi:hypothetical protein
VTRTGGRGELGGAIICEMEGVEVADDGVACWRSSRCRGMTTGSLVVEDEHLERAGWSTSMARASCTSTEKGAELELEEDAGSQPWEKSSLCYCCVGRKAWWLA